MEVVATRKKSPPEYVRKTSLSRGKWWFERYEPWQDLYAQLVVRRNGRVEALANDGLRLLDIGCGFGDILFLLRHRYDEMHGIDPAPVMLEQARNNLRNAKTVSTVVNPGSAENIPYPANHFHTITLLDVFEHIDLHRRHQALLEIRRVLHPDGELILATPSRHVLRFWNVVNNAISLPINLVRRRRSRIWKFVEKSFTEEFSSKQELFADLQQAGFSVTDFHREGFYPAPETMGLAGTWLRHSWKFSLLRSFTTWIFRLFNSIPVFRQKMIVRCVFTEKSVAEHLAA